MYMGRYDEAFRECEPWMQQRSEQRAVDPENMVFAYGTYAELACHSGTHREAALAYMRRAVEIAEHCSPLARIYSFTTLAMTQLLYEESRDARDSVERAVRMMQEVQTGLPLEGLILTVLADAHLGLGEVARACQVAEDAIAVTVARGRRLFEVPSHLAHARALVQVDGREPRRRAQDACATGMRLAEEVGAKIYEPRFREVLGEIARLDGDDAIWARELRTAHRLFTEMGATGHAERVTLLLEESPR